MVAGPDLLSAEYSAANSIEYAPTTVARWDGLGKLISDDGDNFYFTAPSNNNIRSFVRSTGIITTIAGSTSNTAGATNGNATAAFFFSDRYG